MSRDDPRATCATCRYFNRERKVDGGLLIPAKYGGCRFRAPTGVSRPIVDGWPTVNDDDWCGEHGYSRTVNLPAID